MSVFWLGKVKNLQIFGLRNFSLDLAFNIRGHGENTPYSSSVLNESDIVNRHSGGKKLKYILKFYIGMIGVWGYMSRDTRMRNDDVAFCQEHMMFGAEYLGNR